MECRHIKDDCLERAWVMSRMYLSLRKPEAFIALACNQSHPSSAITSILSQ